MFASNSQKKNSSYKTAEDSNTSVHSGQNILPSKMIADVPSGQSLTMERWLLQGLFKVIGQPPIRFELWNGSVIDSTSAISSGLASNPESATSQFTLCLMERHAVYQLLANPSLHFGDLYSAGRLLIDGDLLALLEVLYGELYRMNTKRSTLLKTLWRDQAQPSFSIHDAKENIQHHYDLGNAFYALWLDQQAKMEHICRKLMLKPDMRVVEAGSGWGGLSRFIAEHYQVYVTAYNIPSGQIEYSKKQVALQGHSDRVHYVQDDYRNIEGQFDAFVSVRMLEHMGKQSYSTMAEVIDSCLALVETFSLLHTEIPELYFHKDLLVYAWVFRKGNFLNIGLGQKDNHQLNEHLQAFAEQLQSLRRIPAELPSRFKGHAYILYNHGQRLCDANAALLVGDTDRLAYMQSGEGIRPAMESALMAARIIGDAQGDYSERALKSYQERLQDRFGLRKHKPLLNINFNLPAGFEQVIAGLLMRSSWFIRHVVIDR